MERAVTRQNISVRCVVAIGAEIGAKIGTAGSPAGTACVIRCLHVMRCIRCDEGDRTACNDALGWGEAIDVTRVQIDVMTLLGH